MPHVVAVGAAGTLGSAVVALVGAARLGRREALALWRSNVWSALTLGLLAAAVVTLPIRLLFGDWSDAFALGAAGFGVAFVFGLDV
jgi:hypothetical protein